MDPFSITSGALQIAGACAQITITIIKWVGDVRTVDARISSFCDEVAALRTTYEGLERSLSSPLMAEAARVASQTSDGFHLWKQIQETLNDSKRTVKRVNEVLNHIGQTSGFGRKIRAQLQESLSSGELSRLRQRIHFFNSALALPIQMVCVMLQLEQRGTTSDHQVSLDAKLMAIEKSMRELVESLGQPSRSQTLGGATIVAAEPEGLKSDDGMDTYIAFAKRFLTTASAAASTRSSLSTVSPAIEPDLVLDRRKPSVPELPMAMSERERLVGWIPEPSESTDPSRTQRMGQQRSRSKGQNTRSPADDSEIEFMRTRRHLKLGQERIEQENHAGAETHFRKALTLMDNHDFDGRISFQPAEVVLMLAETCLKQEKLDEAIGLLEPVAGRGTDIFPNVAGNADPMTKRPSSSYRRADKLQALTASHMLGLVFMMKADFDSAEAHGLKAFTERRKELGPQDEKTLESVQLIIDIYRAQGDEEEAEGYEVFLLPPEKSSPSIPREPSPLTVEDSPSAERVLSTQPEFVTARNSRSSFAQRVRHFGRSPQSTQAQSPPIADLHRVSISRSTTLNDSSQDVDIPHTRNDLLRGLHSPSDSSTHERSISVHDDDSITTPSTGVLERSSSSRTVEPTFLAISQLCAEKKFDRAVKVALQFLDSYHSSVMIVRKMELEKNIRRGFGQGLASTGRGYAPLHFFCELKEEHAEEVNLLIKLGVDVNAVAYQAGYTESNPKNPFTALQAAVDRGYSTITTLLLACAGIKTGIRDAEGLTPLMVACRKGHYAIVKQLLNFPLPTEFPLIWHGNTLLHDAARRCDPVLVEMLLDRYPEIDARDKFGKTPLMHAVIKSDVGKAAERERRARGRYRTVQMLLEAGADPTLKDNRTNLSIRDYAAQEMDNGLLALLDEVPRTGTIKMSDAAPALLIVLITILLPPVGVFMVAGCGFDLFVNICLTLLGYIPGHIHAFYLEYVYFDRRDRARHGQLTGRPAPGVYSDRVQSGGGQGYGTI
ncbi:hypothetical protein LTR46_009146 [Exophiala xenobiotica]|nr:hypothetical protein LTR46_009146 [Exophiala xenobiotica]